jgi:hypothetical protein
MLQLIRLPQSMWYYLLNRRRLYELILLTVTVVLLPDSVLKVVFMIPFSVINFIGFTVISGVKYLGLSVFSGATVVS